MYVIEAMIGIGFAVSLLAMNMGVKYWCWRYLKRSNAKMD